jgi:hypothetical protein
MIMRVDQKFDGQRRKLLDRGLNLIVERVITHPSAAL